MENFNRERRRMKEEIQYLRDLTHRLIHPEVCYGGPDFEDYCECGECAASDPGEEMTYVPMEAPGLTGAEELLMRVLSEVQ